MSSSTLYYTFLSGNICDNIQRDGLKKGKKKCARDWIAQKGSKLKVIIKAFLRTLPLRSSPSSQEAFRSSVNPLMTGTPLCLSAHSLTPMQAVGCYWVKTYTLWPLLPHKMCLVSRNSASCLDGGWRWGGLQKKKGPNVTKTGTFLRWMTAFFPTACNKFCRFMQHERNDYHGQKVRLQLNILIEKCTHVKRIEKSIFWEK